MGQTITLQQQLVGAERELAMRRRVYPNWVATHRMKHDKAEYEIAIMEAIVGTLRATMERERTERQLALFGAD